MSVKSSPDRSPKYALYREVGAVDTIANLTRAHGCNSSMYTYCNVQIVPEAGINPNVAIYWWSEEANAFIQEHTAITYAGAGAGTPYEFTVNTYGRIFLVAVTATTGNLKILVSGFNQEQFS